VTELAVSDAIVALRSFPRRYREAFEGLEDAALRARNDGPSIIDRAAGAAARLERFEAALGPALDGLHPKFGGLDEEPPSAALAGAEPEAVLRRIASASTAMASRAEAAPSEAWDRMFSNAGTEHPARWIVQRAVDAGASRLREIERLRSDS
jgi:hypothetical protein